MSWDFETEPEFQRELDWVEDFVREEVEPLDFVIRHAWDMNDPVRRRLIPPLQDVVRERGLWAAHLGPNLGGPGYGQVKLALLNEILGRTHSGAHRVRVPGARFGQRRDPRPLRKRPELKERYLAPLLRNDIVSAFSMTEPQGGSDPTQFVTRAELDGDEWVINGEKWFSSHANFASFLIVLAVTEPDEPAHRKMSMFVVPSDTPGIKILRNVPVYGHADDEGTHSYVRYEDVRIPRENLLGERGQGFAVAQTRLGGGRIHHAMRTVGLVKRAFDMMCERALSRHTKGEVLARKQLVQEMIADSWIQLEQFRLLVLRTAWKIDKYDDYLKVRADISAVKAAMPQVLHDVAARALQVHGSLGVSNEMPFGSMVLESFHMGLADGATEVHKITLARQILGQYVASDDLFPTKHLPKLRAEAHEKYDDLLSAVAGVGS